MSCYWQARKFTGSAPFPNSVGHPVEISRKLDGIGCSGGKAKRMEVKIGLPIFYLLFFASVLALATPISAIIPSHDVAYGGRILHPHFN
jgi:hypothetical protein